MNSIARHPVVVVGAPRTATVFLAAAVAALVIVADRLVNLWSDSPVLLAWIALSVLVFAGMVLFASAARRLAQPIAPMLNRWSRQMANTRADMQMWEAARHDPRLMQELVMVSQRAADLAAAEPTQAAAPAAVAQPATSLVRRVIQDIADTRSAMQAWSDTRYQQPQSGNRSFDQALAPLGLSR